MQLAIMLLNSKMILTYMDTHALMINYCLESENCHLNFHLHMDPKYLNHLKQVR